MASFQAKIGVERPRKRKIKIFFPFRSYPMRDRKFQKNSKNFQKIKKPCYGFFSSQNSLEKAQR